MNQSDFCTACGKQKALFVTTVDGNTKVRFPGETAYMPENIVTQMECACTGCGILYSLNSLSSPIEIYE